MQADREVNPDEIGASRTLCSSLAQIDEIKSSVLEKDRSELRTAYGLKEEPNPLLTLDIDVFQ